MAFAIVSLLSLFSGVSAGVHASTSGHVRAIEDRLVLAGDGVQPSLCVAIDADGRDEPARAGD